jgi:hypothetical protein
VICDNCERPIGDHCRAHLIPCCPGKCSAKDYFPTQKEIDDSLEKIASEEYLTRRRIFLSEVVLALLIFLLGYFVGRWVG